MTKLWDLWEKCPRSEFTKKIGFVGVTNGARTSLWSKELRMFLGCSTVSKFSPESIFITSMKDSEQIHKTIIDCGGVKPTIYAPKHLRDKIYQFIHHAYVMSTQSKNPKIHNKYNLITFNNNSTFTIVIKKRPWVIEVFDNFAVGFSEKRTRLKEEYREGTHDYKKLKRDGVEFQEDFLARVLLVTSV